MIPPIASRFVAGKTAADALEHARRLEDRNVRAIINLLGEHHDRRHVADADAEDYRRLVADIGDSPLRACIAVKPSQIGLAIEESVFRENLEHILDRAREYDVFVWLDMEDHTTTEATIAAFEAVAAEDVGVCLQANLRRTPEDLRRLSDHPGKVRLVKGAYNEPSDIAHQDRAQVDAAYRSLLEEAFRTFDGGVAVATHDPAMIELARELHETHGTGFEFQMLMGVREDAQADLAADHPVYQYVPYGPRWLSYFTRRLAERRENLMFALRAILR